MARLLFALLGVVMALAPDRLRETYERYALVDPEAARPSEWLVPAIRAEGVIYVVATLRGGRPYSWVMNSVGIAGALSALYPERVVDAGSALAYENPDELEWRGSFVSIVRGLGVVCVLLAIRAARKRGD